MTQMIYSDCTAIAVPFFRCLLLSELTKYKHNNEVNVFRKHFNFRYFVFKILVSNDRKETKEQGEMQMVIMETQMAAQKQEGKKPK